MTIMIMTTDMVTDTTTTTTARSKKQIAGLTAQTPA
jgi:hypothetical protein